MHIDDGEVPLIKIDVKGLRIAQFHSLNKAQPRNLRSCRLICLFSFYICHLDHMVIPGPLGADEGKRKLCVERRDRNIEAIDLGACTVLILDGIGCRLQQRRSFFPRIFRGPGEEIEDAL